MNQNTSSTPSVANETDPGLESILSGGAFPGRTTLFVGEVARALRVTKQHVVNLIDEGFLSAIDVASGPLAKKRSLRIPVSSYDSYVRSRANF